MGTFDVIEDKHVIYRDENVKIIVSILVNAEVLHIAYTI